jgi:Tol biopolymer transport system component
MDIFVRERTRDARTRLTFDARSDVAPVWTPDGRRIVYGSSRDGVQNLYWQPADGTGTAERLTTSANPQHPYAFTPDGQTLLYIENDPKTLYDIYALSLTGDRKPRPVLVTPADERRPALSSDGRWMAYQSDESTGTFEVFVRPFPNVDGGRWQVSTGGGSSPLWGDGGHEVLYRQDQVIRRVPVTTTPAFAPGTSVVLLQVPALLGEDTGVNFTYWPGGQRFLMRKTAPGANGVSEYRVVLNWFEELKARAR